MATSRYQNTKNKDYDYHNTFPDVSIQDVISDDDFYYTVKDRERIDQLANRFLGDGRYWWIICLANNISMPFGDGLKPGSIIRIPRNINNVLKHI